MTATPTPLQPIQVEFRTDQMVEWGEKLEAFVKRCCDGLLSYEPVVRNACITMVVTSAGIAAPAAALCYGAYQAVCRLLPKLIEWHNDLMRWVWSPWNFIDLGDHLQEAYDHATDCKQALIRQAMPADQYWEGDAVDAYYDHITTHNAAAGEVESVIKSMRDGLREAGTAGVVATLAALAALLQATIEFILGLVALTPPATPVGAGVITLAITMFGATIAALVIFAQSMIGTVEKLKSEVDGKLRSNDFPGGQWPKATSKSVKDNITNVDGWSYD